VTTVFGLFKKKSQEPKPLKIATINSVEPYEYAGGGAEMVTVCVFNGSYRSSYIIATVLFQNGVATDVALGDGIVVDSPWRDEVIAFATDILPKVRK